MYYRQLQHPLKLVFLVCFSSQCMARIAKVCSSMSVYYCKMVRKMLNWRLVAAQQVNLCCLTELQDSCLLSFWSQKSINRYSSTQQQETDVIISL